MNDSDRFGVSTGIYKVSPSLMYKWRCPIHEDYNTGKSQNVARSLALTGIVSLALGYVAY